MIRGLTTPDTAPEDKTIARFYWPISEADASAPILQIDQRQGMHLNTKIHKSRSGGFGSDRPPGFMDTQQHVHRTRYVSERVSVNYSPSGTSSDPAARSHHHAAFRASLLTLTPSSCPHQGSRPHLFPATGARNTKRNSHLQPCVRRTSVSFQRARARARTRRSIVVLGTQHPHTSQCLWITSPLEQTSLWRSRSRRNTIGAKRRYSTGRGT